MIRQCHLEKDLIFYIVYYNSFCYKYLLHFLGIERIY